VIKPYYETKLGKLYHGDCLEIMPELEPVDLVLTDPPWNMGYFKGDKDEWSQYCEKLKKWVKISLIGKNQIIFQSSKSISHTSSIFEGWMPFIAVKNFSQMNPKHLPNCFDIAYIRNNEFYKGNGRNWFLSNTAGMLRQRNEHPTPRAEDVMMYLLDIFDAQKICDPFLGSGTTAIACERLKRKWIGIEIEEKYCEIAAKRIEENLTVIEKIERSEKGITKKTGLLF